MSSVKSSISPNVPVVAPPTPQEITRKLSVHNKPIKHTVHPPVQQVSGTESDSDTALSPELSPSAGGHTISGGFAIAGSSTQKPLSSIAERTGGSGEGEESDEDEEEGGWRTGVSGRANPAGEEAVLKTGYLWKKGERRKTWKKRWFVLRPAHLAFYKSSAEYKLLRLLELSEVHACTPVTLKRHANAFGLVSPTRTYYLQAETAEEVRSWVAALNNAREQLMNANTNMNTNSNVNMATTTTKSSSTSAPIPIPGTPTRTRSGALAASSSPVSQRGGQGPGQSHMSMSVTASSPSQHAPVTSESESDEPCTGDDGNSNIAPPMQVAMSPSKIISTSPKDLTKTVLSGYLMKCRSKRRQWRKRWFVLTGEKLMYSASHMDTRRQRSVELSEVLDALEYDLPSSAPRHYGGGASVSSSGSPAPVTSSSHPKASEEEGGGGGTTHGGGEGAAHVFKIVMTKRSLLLCAPSEEEEIKWLSAVRALIARRSVNATTQSVGGTTSSPQHARRTSLSFTGRQRSTSTSQSIHQPAVVV